MTAKQTRIQHWGLEQMITSELRSAAALGLSAMLLLAASPARAADSQFWSNGSVTVKLSDKWSVSQDLTARFSDKRNGLYELEANTLLGYRFNKNLTLWGGYDHDPQYSGGDFSIMEHRAVEILAVDTIATIGRGKLSGRARFEQRWRVGRSGTGWRLRPYLRYALPFKKGGKTSFVWSEEMFLDLNTTSYQTVHGVERLRSFVGISTPLNKKLSVDVGYLNQHGFVPNGKDTSDNVANISFGLKL
jgi:Protein of unknown function (DUF2490)